MKLYFFLLLGYSFKEYYRCDGIVIARYYYDFQSAIFDCNGDDGCRCVEYESFNGYYYTVTSSSTYYDPYTD